METEQLYEAYQPLLFSLAYRILGSVMDAEDIVHDVFISLNNIGDVRSIENMKAYLCKMTTNRSIDKFRSAAHKRNTYVGMWLPEVEEIVEPSESLVMKESLSTAYLLLLQQLSEGERIREVFSYDYEEIASIVNKSSVNCRKIFQRARKSILEKPKKSKLSTKKMSTYIEKFVSSLQCGDAQGMLEVLKTDAIFKVDGGGKVITAIHPIYSADKIICLFFGIAKRLPEEYIVDFKMVNGVPGVIVTINNKVTYVLSFVFEDEKISNIYMMANPDKLMHLNV